MRNQGNRDLKDLAILFWVVLVFTVCLLFVSERQSEAERDFVYFYSVGRIADTQRPERVYDFEVQRRTFESVYRLKRGGVYGPSPYPPFIPLLFRALARLPFQTAYYVWQVCTLVLYCTGIGLLARAIWPRQRVAQSLVFAAAFSFAPFVADTLAAGQLAAIGCFAICLTLYEQGRAHLFRSGLALSLGLYKPTLLVLLVPMLLVRKQWRTLAGLITGGVALLSLVKITMGMGVWRSYFAMLSSLGPLQGLLDFSRYVDVVAFSALLAHNHPSIKGIVVASSLAAFGSFLVRAWLRSKNDQIIWATTITWTLLLNVYVPIYDAVLVVPSIIWSAPVLLGRNQRAFTLVTLLIFGISWASELVARTIGIQLLSVAIALLGVLQLRALGPPSKHGS